MKLISACGMQLVLTLTLSVFELVASQLHHSIKSNGVIRISDAVLTRRHRRQAQTLTTNQVSEIVDHHNILRALEGADNMQRMRWSDFLASLAVTWAARCNFSHGQPPLGDNPPYTVIGQNLYAGTAGSGVNLTAGIQAWYNEKADYNYDTTQCADKKVCGHYTQVVWSSSREVGCGLHLCSKVASTMLSNAYYLVCNYGPAGNFQGQKPYTKGPACSKCDGGAGWCKNGLCNSNCSSAGEDCLVCEDTDARCNNNGWPPSWCNQAYVRSGCPVMCNLCTPDANAVPGQCPPVTGNGTSVTPSAGSTTSATATTTASASAKFARCQQATITFAVVLLGMLAFASSSTLLAKS